MTRVAFLAVIALSLSGCFIPHHRPHIPHHLAAVQPCSHGVWVNGHIGPNGIWVDGHCR